MTDSRTEAGKIQDKPEASWSARKQESVHICMYTHTHAYTRTQTLTHTHNEGYIKGLKEPTEKSING